MKKQKFSSSLRYLWLAGGGGFGIAFLSSELGGNLLWTSFKRGLIGFVIIFLLYWVIQFLIPPGKHEQTPDHADDDLGEAASKGTHFDVSLPAEPLDGSPSPHDFQPWVIGSQESSEEQIENMVQAIRTMQK
jgi:hypothetical protein